MSTISGGIEVATGATGGPPPEEAEWVAAAFRASMSAHLVTKVQPFDFVAPGGVQRITLVFGNAYNAPIGPGGSVVSEVATLAAVTMDLPTLQFLVNTLAQGYNIRAEA